MIIIIIILAITQTLNGEWIGHKYEGQKQILRPGTELNSQQDWIYTPFFPGILVKG